LSPEQLTGPSAASEWDISQVLSHLGSGAVINLAVLEAALAGEPNPGSDFNKEVWARWDAMTPAERVEGFLKHNEILTARFESLDAQTRTSQMVDMGFLPAPVDIATVASFRLSELTLHSWDVRVSEDPAATLHPQATPLLLDQSPLNMEWCTTPDALHNKRALLYVDTSDPQRNFTLRLAEMISLTRGAPESFDGVFTIPGESLLRLIAGRLAPEWTPESVMIDGGEVDLTDLRRVFTGY
jgi:uncharacterized protein (TIGR03083 family)